MTHKPALDGIRAVAVAMVMGFHASAPGASGGYLGVDVFFVLSGFLITSLLLQEIDTTGSIDLRRFYLRRLLRLTPALVLMLLAYLLAAPLLWPKVPFVRDLEDVFIALFYVADYANAFWSVPVRLRHSWSLSVEEHFYLMWPLLLLWLARLSRRRMATVLAGLYAAFSVWRVLWDFDGAAGYTESYYRFDTRLSGLTIGGLLALLLTDNSAVENRRADFVAAGALAVLGYCSLHFQIASRMAMSFGMAAVELSTVVLIYTAVNAQSSIVTSLLANPLVSFVGRMSYGVYLWHYPIFFWLWGRLPWYLIMIVGGGASLLLAVISYYSVERIARAYWARKNARLPTIALGRTGVASAASPSPSPDRAASP